MNKSDLELGYPAGAPSHGKRPSLRDILSRGHLRLVLLSVVLAAAGLTITGGILIRGYADANVALTARTVSYAVEPAVLFEDSESVSQIVRSLGGRANIRAIEVRGSDDAVLGRWERQAGDLSFQIDSLFGDLLTGGPQTVEVMFDGNAIGEVTVVGSSQAMLRYAVAGLVIAMACLGIIILATRLLARRLEQDVLAPIEHVSAVAHEVSTQRDFERRVDPSGVAEIDQLVGDFNALLGQLQAWHEALTSENIELTHRAEHDPLTGLGNRDRFRRMLNIAMEAADRDEGSLSVLYVDIDRFKEINDSYGHDVGDAAICAVADHLQRSTTERGSVFRLGGDEFALLLCNSPTPDAVDRVVSRIKGNLATPFMVALSQEHSLDVSIGIASYPADGESARKLLRAADRRMYDVKQGRRNSESPTH